MPSKKTSEKEDVAVSAKKKVVRKKSNPKDEEFKEQIKKAIDAGEFELAKQLMNLSQGQPVATATQQPIPINQNDKRYAQLQTFTGPSKIKFVEDRSVPREKVSYPTERSPRRPPAQLISVTCDRCHHTFQVYQSQLPDPSTGIKFKCNDCARGG